MIFLLSDINIENVYARVGMKGGSSAVYMKIKNNQTAVDTLYGVRCDCANMTMIHSTIREDNTLRMVELKEVEIVKEVDFKPGGMHIMLIDLKEDLKEGDTIKLNLKFRKAGEKEILVPVKKN